MAQEQYFTGLNEIRITPNTVIMAPTVEALKILYTKPNGTDGEVVASADGTEMIATVNIDMPGDWQFQSFVQRSGRQYRGKVAYQTFNEPLS